MEPKHDKVELADFQRVMEDALESALQNEKIDEAFEIFDQDRKQYFDASDLHRVMAGLGENLTKKHINDMVRDPVRNVIVSRRLWRSTARVT